jgi:hypothetical protein
MWVSANEQVADSEQVPYCVYYSYSYLTQYPDYH